MIIFTVDDYRFMAQALRLAARGLLTATPNPRVGCVLVRDGQVVAEGWHHRAGEAHAEINALQQINYAAQGCTAYITLEPCCHHGKTPPCTDALINSGIRRVAVSMLDPNPRVAGKGMHALAAAGIEIQTGLLAAEAADLNQGHINRFTLKKPFVRLKMAMSFDGRTALASGESQWITGKEARDDVQRLRGRSSAIMTGIGTILRDDPALNVRFEAVAVERADQPLIRQPMRIILDSHLRLPVNAKTLKLPGDVLVITSLPDKALIQNRLSEISRANLEIVQVAPDAEGRPDLLQVMPILAEGGINELHVECGPILAGALLTAGLIDELVFYMAPHLLGNSAQGLFVIPGGLERMQNRIALEITEIRRVGGDYRIKAIPNPK